MDEYFCPKCGATLNDQYGFDPSCGAWTCTSCGKLLMDDDVYDGDIFEGVAWYCDDCGALLNRQLGFSDSYDSWQCTNCGHINGTTEEDIIDDEPKCPNCEASLKDQYSYSDWSDDYTCSECGAKLHRSYSSDPFEVVEEDERSICPGCGASLNEQYSFSDWYNDYTCLECGAKLHRSYSGDPFEIVEEDEKNKCPNCGAALDEQYGFDDYEDDWECTECGTHLHHNYSSDPYEVVDDNEEDADVEDSSSTKGYYSSLHSASRYSTDGSKTIISGFFGSKKEKRIPESELKKQRRKAFLFKRKKIQIGFGYTDLLRRNVKDVEIRLHNQAFNNIKTIPIKDIYKDTIYTEGEVEQVVIAGSSYFNEGDMIPYDVEIVVTYHAKKEITIPFAEKSLRKMNYVEAGDKLQELGFTEIYEHPICDLVTGWVKKDGSVDKVTIGDVYPFKKNSVFTYDTKIIIEYHTFKK